MRNKECIDKIKELINIAEEDFEESKEDMNSYGHGYDTGRLSGLNEALELLESD